MSAVIFDLEGTLVDVSDYHVLAFQEVIKRHYNLAFTRGDFLAGYGRHAWRIAELFLKMHGINASEGECRRLAEEKQEILRAKYSDKVRVLPGVRELLSNLKSNGVRIALASSSPRRNVEFMLKNPGLWDFFEAVVAVEDVPEAKPDPRIFLLAAERLGVNPKDCVVIEDSVHGVKAGKAAGMRVVAVTTGGTPAEKLSAERPDRVLRDLVGVKAGDLKSV